MGSPHAAVEVDAKGVLSMTWEHATSRFGKVGCSSARCEYDFALFSVLLLVFGSLAPTKESSCDPQTSNARDCLSSV